MCFPEVDMLAHMPQSGAKFYHINLLISSQACEDSQSQYMCESIKDSTFKILSLQVSNFP